MAMIFLRMKVRDMNMGVATLCDYRPGVWLPALGSYTHMKIEDPDESVCFENLGSKRVDALARALTLLALKVFNANTLILVFSLQVTECTACCNSTRQLQKNHPWALFFLCCLLTRHITHAHTHAYMTYAWCEGLVTTSRQKNSLEIKVVQKPGPYLFFLEHRHW